MRTLNAWWSPAAQCWRIEDGEMFTYYELDQVLGHLKDRDAAALIVAPPHAERTVLLDQALRRNGITIVYDHVSDERSTP